MKTNVKTNHHNRLAGDYGPIAAKQTTEFLLRRAVLACLLWENIAYKSGNDIVKNIINLIPKVESEKVASIAIEAREKQNLRHVPLLLAREMARINPHKKLVASLLPKIIQRADEITEFLSLYWKEKKQPVSKQVKKGLALAFDKFDAYQFAKYNTRTSRVSFRDVLALTHAKPSPGKKELYRQIASNTLPTPYTWEVALSRKGVDKKIEWERLLKSNKLGALALLRNLKNMVEAGCDKEIIRVALDRINVSKILPLNFFAAVDNCPVFEREIETAMLRSFANVQKTRGKTIIVVDVSSSMDVSLSSKSKYTRLDAACAMLIMARELFEQTAIYATAGSDNRREHLTRKLDDKIKGFNISKLIQDCKNTMGGGGIFTRQCLDFVRKEEGRGNRLICFTDSQDCDHKYSAKPDTSFADMRYIIDISSENKGINYPDNWDAEITGWSEYFLNFIIEYESLRGE
jgi:hypothetical protein